MTPVASQRDLDQLYRSAAAYAVLCAWADSGMLKALADGEARRPVDLGGDERAIRATAPILGHLGILVTDGERWALSKTAKALLEARALPTRQIMDIFGDLGQLATILREGGPARAADGSSRVTEGGVRQGDAEQTRSFLDMLYRRSVDSAEDTARWIAKHLPTGAHVLDVGGGHGRYSRELVDRGMRATVLDRNVVVELARERYGDTLAYISGDFLLDELGGPYDAALLSNIIHGLDPDENARLLSRVRGALRPGGLLVIKDMLLDDLGVHPSNAAFFGLTMLLFTRGGRSYSVREITNLCLESGLRATDHMVIPDGDYSLFFARSETSA